MIAWVLLLIVGAADPWQARFPEDDVVIVEHETRVSILSDGRSITWHRRVTRPLSIVGREDYSDFRIGYVIPHQTVRVIRCAALRSDGTEVQAQPHAFNLVTPGAYGTAPDFVSCRELVVSPPGVEEGVEIVVEYEVVDSTLLPWYEAVIPLGDIHPVLRRMITVDNHGSQPLAWALCNAQGCSLGTDASASSWHFNDLPAYPSKRGPSGHTVEPRLVLSTCPSWPELAGWWAGRLPEDSLWAREAAESLGVGLRTAVTRDETLKVVVDVARAAVHLVPAPDRRFWTCRDPSRVYASGYAEPLEAAWLVAVSARSAGYDAVVCLVGDALPAGMPPVTSLLPEAWVRVRESVPRWLNLTEPRQLPRVAGPFGFLPLTVGGDPVRGADPVIRRGHAVLTLAKSGADSMRVRGSITVSASLVPDGVDRAAPDGWLGPRLKRIVKGATLAFVCERICDDDLRYRFEGAMPVGEGILIDQCMEAWFGSDWVPAGVAASDVIPRVPVLIPADVELISELRIARSEELEVICSSDSLAITTDIGSLRAATVHTPELIRMRRFCRLDAGWLDGEGILAVRRMMAEEGRRRESSVFILPSSE
ncbi:DUF3857 domain-containing protein [Candidatus Fermentibacteria bacterium]|nr:DUF3857 domain-containing protein [Candidatus Fermentibacteria bacterium]